MLYEVITDKYSTLLNNLEFFGFIIVLFVIFYTPVWPLVLQPLINLIVHFLAGEQSAVVFKVLLFLRA